MTVLEVIRKSTSTSAEPTDTLDSLGLDSLEFVELVKDIETAFSIEIPNAKISHLHSVEELIDLVYRLQNTNNVCG